MKIKDFYGENPTFGLSRETLDDYCHVIDETIDNLQEEDDNSNELCFTKKDINDGKIDLSSFKPQISLNERIWPNGLINSRVRLKLLDIADDFFNDLDIDWVKKPEDIILTGSLANYNWSKYSDFDLHLIIDFKKVDKRVDFVDNYFYAKKDLWNEEHDNLKIYGFPVELYVQDVTEDFSAMSGVYSLEKNKWLVKPNPNKIKAIKLNKFTIKEKTLKFIKQINKLQNEFDNTDDSYKIEQISKKIKRVWDKIKNLRKESLENGGEMSNGNIIFKCLRRFGYLEKITDLKTNTYDKMNSIY